MCTALYFSPTTSKFQLLPLLHLHPRRALQTLTIGLHTHISHINTHILNIKWLLLRLRSNTPLCRRATSHPRDSSSSKTLLASISLRNPLPKLTRLNTSWAHSNAYTSVIGLLPIVLVYYPSPSKNSCRNSGTTIYPQTESKQSAPTFLA